MTSKPQKLLRLGTGAFILATVGLVVLLGLTEGSFKRSSYIYRSVASTSDNGTSIDLDATFVQFGSNKKISLRQFVKGKQGVLVNFWATWCPPCLEELPSLEYLHRQLQKKSDMPQLVAVSVDEKLDAVSKQVARLDFSLSIPILHDSEGKFAQTLGISKFPETWWVSNEGKLIHKWIGPQNWVGQDFSSVLAQK